MVKYFLSLLVIIVSMIACSKNEDVFRGLEHENNHSQQSEVFQSPSEEAQSLRALQSSSSYTLSRGGESIEVVLRANASFGFPVLTISNSRKSGDDVQYVIYARRSTDGSWEEFDSSWVDISPGKSKSITFNPNERNFDRGVLKLKLVHDGWSSSRDKVYVDVSFQ